MTDHQRARGRPQRRTFGMAAAAVGTLVFGGVVLAQPAGAAPSGGTEYVATTGVDTGTCRIAAHPCQTIDYALTLATANTTIKAAKGTYPEQVIVDGTQSVTIIGGWVPPGGSAGTTVIDPTSLQADGNGRSAIIEAQPGAKLTLQKLSVQGDGARSQFTDCNARYYGVLYQDASGVMSTVTVNGIELAQPSLGGCQTGLAVSVISPSASSTVSIHDVTATNYQKNGITCANAGTTCAISNSKVNGGGPSTIIARNGVQASDGAAATIFNSTITANSYTSPHYPDSYANSSGILLYDAGNVTAKSNVVTDNDVNIYAYRSAGGSPVLAIKNNTASKAVNNTGPAHNNPADCPGGTCTTVPFDFGLGDGIVLDGVAGGVVSGNQANSNVEYGIALYAATNSQVTSNTANQSGDGIYVGSYNGSPSTGNTVKSNTTKNNLSDGILATADSNTNIFNNDHMITNADFDAHDLSTGGTGTAGTDNTWSSNTCSPPHDSSPAGLC